MARSTDPKKLALWQGRFQRFVESGLPVVRFCAAEGVSEASFYYWQKKLGPPRGDDVLAEDDGLSVKARGVRPEGSRRDASGHGVFRPVTVVPATCGVVVQLPGGTRIEVSAEHLDAIQTVVAETVRGDHDLATGRNVPSDNHVNGKRGGAVSC